MAPVHWTLALVVSAVPAGVVAFAPRRSALLLRPPPSRLQAEGSKQGGGFFGDLFKPLPAADPAEILRARGQAVLERARQAKAEARLAGPEGVALGQVSEMKR